jgi:hypothetical protein
LFKRFKINTPIGPFILRESIKAYRQGDKTRKEMKQQNERQGDKGRKGNKATKGNIVTAINSEITASIQCHYLYK